MLETLGDKVDEGVVGSRAGAEVAAAPEISWRMPSARPGPDELRVEIAAALGTPDAYDGGGPEALGGGFPDPSIQRVISVLCPKGGTGRTTVATNVAIGLAQFAPGQVVIVDLDLQFGDVATTLKLTPQYTFAHTARSRPSDRSTLKASLTSHPANLFVLCAPVSPVEAEDLTVEHVQRVLALLVESFRYVVIDTPSGLDENTLTAIDLSTDLVVLCATDVPAVRATLKELDVLRAITQPEQRTHFVLNRADARTGLNQTAIETVVGLEVDVAIPSSGTVPLALNQGTPILEADARSPVSLAMAELVDRLVPDFAKPRTRKRAGGRRRRGT